MLATSSRAQHRRRIAGRAAVGRRRAAGRGAPPRSAPAGPERGPGRPGRRCRRWRRSGRGRSWGPVPGRGRPGCGRRRGGGRRWSRCPSAPVPRSRRFRTGSRRPARSRPGPRHAAVRRRLGAAPNATPRSGRGRGWRRRGTAGRGGLRPARPNASRQPGPGSWRRPRRASGPWPPPCPNRRSRTAATSATGRCLPAGRWRRRGRRSTSRCRPASVEATVWEGDVGFGRRGDHRPWRGGDGGDDEPGGLARAGRSEDHGGLLVAAPRRDRGYRSPDGGRAMASVPVGRGRGRLEDVGGRGR